MSPMQIIVLATTVFILLIIFEFAWGLARGCNTYQLDDTINSISLGLLNQISGVFTSLLVVGLYTAVYLYFPQFHNENFWNAWYSWPLALICYDFCYYWKHRASHECAVFWAAHVVHHQSQSFNLSTGLRQPSTDALLGWFFFLPMAVAGVPPQVFIVVALIVLIYQYWVHTDHIGYMGWFDNWFSSPSNHRVHHSVNMRYMDRNYGGILIVWDRIFGTYQEEDGPCVYGTRAQLDSWDPLWANTDVYWHLLKDCWHARNWFDKIRIWFKPPGWRPADVAERFPQPAFEMARITHYAPVIPRINRIVGIIHFMVLLAGAVGFLWFAESWPLTTSAIGLTVLSIGLWSTGAILQGRLPLRELLLVECAVLATATGALGLTQWHYVFKPLTLSIAMILIMMDPRASDDSRQFKVFLLLALLASLTGDVLLMLPGDYLLAGLLAYGVANIYYLLLMQRRSTPSLWFPRRWFLVAMLLTAAATLAYLWPGLHGWVLISGLGVSLLLVALMSAQALGRAMVQGQRSATLVAIGTLSFMLSISLLAVNRFIQPLPMISLWVLATYYLAQLLLARHLLKKS